MRIETSMNPINNEYATSASSLANDDTFSKIYNKKAEQKEVENNKNVMTSSIDIIGSTAPEAVRQAWVETAQETGVNAFTGISSDGLQGHITQMLVQIVIRQHNGEANPENVLGNSIESAMNAAKKAIYDIDHPLAGQPQKSLRIQQEIMKERDFYERFINKLMSLTDIRSESE